MSEDPSVPSWMWENRKDLLVCFKKLRQWLRPSNGGTEGQDSTDNEEKPGILILGPGGVGKTTLGRTLCGEFISPFAIPGAYEESFDLETYGYADMNCELVAPPGQRFRRGDWDQLLGAIGDSRFRGIIVMGAYGYHSLGEMSYLEHKLYKGDKDAFLQRYLEAGRKDERDILNSLVPYVRAAKGRIWLLNLITKQDLWWFDKEAVRNEYRKAQEKVRKVILETRSMQDFRYELHFSSLVLSNFTAGKGETLANISPGYDQQRQIDSTRRFVEILDALRIWETGSE